MDGPAVNSRGEDNKCIYFTIVGRVSVEAAVLASKCGNLVYNLRMKNKE